MRMLFTADLHYALKQFDWLLANARRFDAIVIGGDLLDLSSPLDFEVQIVVVEKYLDRLRQEAAFWCAPGITMGIAVTLRMNPSQHGCRRRASAG